MVSQENLGAQIGGSKVRSVSLVRVLEDDKTSWARCPKVCVIVHLPQLKHSKCRGCGVQAWGARQLATSVRYCFC